MLDWATKPLLEADRASTLLEIVQDTTGVAGGILRTRDGVDFPIRAARGFPDDYIRRHQSLLDRTPNAAGPSTPVGMTDDGPLCGPKNSEFVTAAGSVCIPDQQVLRRHDNTRLDGFDWQRWLPEQFESHVWIPLRHKTVVTGVVQLGDPRPAMLSLDDVTFLERLLARVASTLLPQEDLNRSIVDQLDVGVFLSTIEGRFIHVNPATVHLGGWSTSEELLALPSDRLYANDEDRKRFVEQLTATGSVRHFETAMKRQDETLRPVSLSAVLLDPPTARTRCVLGTVEDISERKRTEQALRSSERKFSRVFHGGAGAFAITSFDQDRFVDVNARFLETTGFTREEVVGKTVLELGLWRDPRQVHHFWALLQAQGSVAGFQGRFRKKTGETVQGLVSAAIIDMDGVAHLLTEIVDITELQQKTEQLELLKLSIDQAPDCAYWLDRDGNFLYINDAACTALGYTSEELLRLHISDINPRATRERWTEVWQALKTRGAVKIESEHRRKDGSTFPVALTSAYFRCGDREYCNGFAVDISERRQRERERETLQAQLVQAQKMESVGRLAGGIAHDFNNMLSVILGNTELALAQLDSDETLRADLSEIQAAARRSADLTAQLLAFARRQPIAPRIVDLNATVGGVLKMLERLIGEDIRLVWQPTPEIWPVRIDPSQISQILANLTVNARDAIAGHGTLHIWTRNFTTSDVSADGTSVAVSGDYVQIGMSDTGCGMTAEVQAHLFEPFFTTKAQGKGTGLGLATIYGIVEQNGGFISVQSQIGAGSTFTVHLPRYLGEHGVEQVLDLPSGLRGGDEVLLLVEDEASVLRLGRRMLEGLGYRVLTASCALDALELAHEQHCRIDLLITDVVMPQMNGRELGEKMATICPGIRQLFMSGYTSAIIAPDVPTQTEFHFLQKPFSLESLATKVREALAKT